MTVAAAVGVLPRRMAGWAARQSLAPNALTGIGLACSICAAAWFSAGTRSSAVAGGLALSAGYLARRVGAQVAAARGRRGSRPGQCGGRAGRPGPCWPASRPGWPASARRRENSRSTPGSRLVRPRASGTASGCWPPTRRSRSPSARWPRCAGRGRAGPAHRPARRLATGGESAPHAAHGGADRRDRRDGPAVGCANHLPGPHRLRRGRRGVGSGPGRPDLGRPAGCRPWPARAGSLPAVTTGRSPGWPAGSSRANWCRFPPRWPGWPRPSCWRPSAWAT